MKRRDFIAFLSGTAFVPFGLRAQQPDQARKLAVIMAVAKTPEYVAASAALQQVLGGLGWKQGDNLRIDDRWSAGSQERARAVALEIAASKPDVILGQSLEAEDNTVTTYLSARVGNILLLEKPSDQQSRRRIDCYSIDVEDFDAARELWKVVGFKYKIAPQRILFRISYQHNANPPDLKLKVLQDPSLWFDRVGIDLLGELCQCEPHTRDRLRGAVADFFLDRTSKHLA
jgi:hypothetical protein